MSITMPMYATPKFVRIQLLLRLPTAVVHMKYAAIAKPLLIALEKNQDNAPILRAVRITLSMVRPHSHPSDPALLCSTAH